MNLSTFRSCQKLIPNLKINYWVNCSKSSIFYNFKPLQNNLIRPFNISAALQSDLDDEILGKGEKLIKLKMTTNRLDAILKAGLSISKSKIEKAFYADKIRVNGERPKKKSQLIFEGEEIDIIKKTNEINPKFIDVARVEVVELELGNLMDSNNKNSSKNKNKGKVSYNEEDDDDDEDSNKFPVILRRFKNLTIENYKGVSWKSTESDS